MDRELSGRKPVQWPHGEVVGTAVMEGKLSGEVVELIKAVEGIKPFLILPVAALHLTVVPWRIGTDELVMDAQFGGGDFKQCRQISLAVGKTVGELKPVIRLDALNPDAPTDIPLP